MMHTPPLWACVLALAVLAAAACQDIADPVAGEDEPGLAQTPVDELCQDVADEVLDAIAQRLTVEATMVNAYAVDAMDEDVTFVAAELDSEEFHSDEPPIGIWAVKGETTTGGDVLAVNSIAREHSTWRFEEGVTQHAGGAEEAKACVEGG